MCTKHSGDISNCSKKKKNRFWNLSLHESSNRKEICFFLPYVSGFHNFGIVRRRGKRRGDRKTKYGQESLKYMTSPLQK